MSTLMLLGLSVILALLAARLLRRAPKGALAALALALVTTAAGVAHSHPNDIVVEGGECSTEFTHEYNPLAGPFLLVSACANPIRIVALGVDCFPPGETLGDVTSNAAIPCEEGLVLPPNGQCELPSCPS